MSWWRDWNNDNEFEFEVDIDKEFEIKADFEFDIEYDLDLEIEKKIDVYNDFDQKVDLDGNVAVVTSNVDIVTDPKDNDNGGDPKYDSNGDMIVPTVQVAAITDIFGSTSQGQYSGGGYDVVALSTADSSETLSLPYIGDVTIPLKTGTFTELNFDVEIFPHGSNTTIVMESVTDTDIFG